MTTNQEPLTHHDYADAAEAAQRGEAWAQAATLWRRAVETLPPGRGRNATKQRDHYLDRARDCDQRTVVESRLEEIAKTILRIPTLAERRSDSLDFHELGVWQIKRALQAAYDAGRASKK
jgi:hypothetical protein